MSCLHATLGSASRLRGPGHGHAELKQSKAELAVHKRKVEDVRRWLIEAFEGGPSAKLRKYRVRVCRYEPLEAEHIRGLSCP